MTSNSALVISPMKDDLFIPTLSPEKLQSIRSFGRYLSEDKENIDPVNFTYSSCDKSVKEGNTPVHEGVLYYKPQPENKKNQPENKKRQKLAAIPVKMLR